MTAAKAKLAAANKKMADSEAEQVRQQLEAAKHTMRGVLNDLAGARARVSAAISARRIAYNQAGQAAGNLAEGGASSKAKVAGLVAAIPIVETVVSALRGIVSTSEAGVPPYSDDAGVGVGIALYHQSDPAWTLPNAVGSIASCYTYFGDLLIDWQQRLKLLLAKKDELSGTELSGTQPRG